MGENAADFLLDPLCRPGGMLAFQEGGFMPAHRPVEAMSGLPALLRRHAPKNLELFRTGLFVRQHAKQDASEGAGKQVRARSSGEFRTSAGSTATTSEIVKHLRSFAVDPP